MNDIWLSKNEIKLLRYYYHLVNKEYSVDVDLSKEYLLKSIGIIDGFSSPIFFNETDLPIDCMENSSYSRVKSINNLLMEKGLISIGYSYRDYERNKVGEVISHSKYICLTKDGYDLSQQYFNIFHFLSLWGNRNKYNPIWLFISHIIVYIAGIILGWIL